MIKIPTDLQWSQGLDEGLSLSGCDNEVITLHSDKQLDNRP